MDNLGGGGEEGRRGREAKRKEKKGYGTQGQ